MKRWGALVTFLYILILFVLLEPLGAWLTGLAEPDMSFADTVTAPRWWYVEEEWVLALIWGGILVGCQSLLLFVSVDTSFRRLKPQRHIALSAAVTGVCILILVVSMLWSLLVAIRNEDTLGGWEFLILALIGATWVVWAAIFRLYKSNRSDRLNQMLGWIIKGSILELLIVVPCHVVVRSRNDCCAPLVTGYGIATGLAVMLLAFGPSVLFLFQKQMQRYAAKDALNKSD